MSGPPPLIVPGRGNSGPGHWQTWLEQQLPGAVRVEQADWAAPDLEAWAERIDTVARQMPEPPLVIAHSFGCLAAARARQTRHTPFGALLLVAPADSERFGWPRAALARPLHCPGLVVASENDPWLSLDGARALATAWGLGHLNLGRAGHINVASGHGPWPLGAALAAWLRGVPRAAQLPGRAAPDAAARPAHRAPPADLRQPAWS